MRLTVLGSGTSSPSVERRAAGYLLEAGRERWLFDMGLGTLHRLLEAGVGWDRIDRIFFSHAHVDHHLEIVHLLFDNNNFAQPRTRNLHVYGSRPFLEFFRSLREVYGKWVEPAAYRLQCHEVGETEMGIAGFRVAGRPVAHIPSSVAYRVESPEGKAFVYSGDTDFCAAIVDLARGADLLLIECSTPNAAKVAGHLTPRLAGEVGARAGVRRLVLTHFYPACEKADVEAECREAYSGEILLARDLLRLEI
ncbi:MAG: MBL fold metallo-hydrolase [Acidobacteria bacterium]|nr:MBL fold metallo-hydrolase [Acidobacteriota bacterium]